MPTVAPPGIGSTRHRWSIAKRNAPSRFRWFDFFSSPPHSQRSFVRSDWGTAKPLDKQVTSTPIKRDEKRVGVPEEVKGKEMEVLWPTERDVQEGELKKPQWERKQINVSIDADFTHPHLSSFSTFGTATISVINFAMR